MTLHVRQQACGDTSYRQLGQAGCGSPICGGTGLFSHKGRCAHGAGSTRLGMTRTFRENSFRKTTGRSRRTWCRRLAGHVTIAERLKEVGYANAFLGKWHAPSAGKGQGGGRTFAFKPGVRHQHWRRLIRWAAEFFLAVPDCDAAGWRTRGIPADRLVNETIGFIRDNKSKPWMVQLWFYTVHWPMQAPEALLNKYENRKAWTERHSLRSDDRGDGPSDGPVAGIARVGKRRRWSCLVTMAASRGCRIAGRCANQGHLYEGGIRVPTYVGRGRWRLG